MRRIMDVARIQTVNWTILLGLPLGVLTAAFLVNWVVYAVVGSAAPPDNRVSGAMLSIYFVVATTHLQTITQMFGLALGLGVTRRAFYQATVLVAVLQAALMGLVLTVLAALERATDGWGVRMQFFTFPFLSVENVLVQWAVYTVPFIALSAVGVLAGVIFKRWGQIGVYVGGVVTLLIAAVFVVVVTLQDAWPAVGAFFAHAPAPALFAGYPLVLAVLVGALGFVLIRRATP